VRVKDYQKTNLRPQSLLPKRKTKRTFKSASGRLEQAFPWMNPTLASLICTRLARIENTELIVIVPHSTTTLARRCHQEPATFNLWAQWRQYLFKFTRTKTPATILWLALWATNNRCRSGQTIGVQLSKEGALTVIHSTLATLREIETRVVMIVAKGT